MTKHQAAFYECCSGSLTPLLPSIPSSFSPSTMRKAQELESADVGQGSGWSLHAMTSCKSLLSASWQPGKKQHAPLPSLRKAARSSGETGYLETVRCYSELWDLSQSCWQLRSLHRVPPSTCSQLPGPGSSEPVGDTSQMNATQTFI